VTEKKMRVLAALLTNPTREQAAAAAGVNSRTLRAYLEDPEFQREYQKAYREIVQDATRQAQQGISPAIVALRTIIEDEEQPASARISAARSILEYGLKLTEVNDILEKLKALEAQG
jgi:hypothetical protein